MRKPNKKGINASKESILVLMQEVYNELAEQRNTAVKIQNKMLALLKEPEDMVTIGPVLKEQQKIINECAEKKLTMTKILSTMWQKSANTEENFSFTDLDDEALENILSKDVTDELGKYKIM